MIKAPFPWFGGKRDAASHVWTALGDVAHYVEPFELLMADPAWHDPTMAGWWLWGQSSWIGSGWCSGAGRWIVGADGRITKRNGGEPGPHVSDNGRGVTHASMREPGVQRQLPHLCAEHGADPKLRIVLAGFEGEHEALAPLGWRSVEWYRKGFLRGGMANRTDAGTQQHRERLWLSPHCLGATAKAQMELWA